MNILILSNSGGGFYLFRKELIQRLSGEGHRVWLSVPPGAYADALEGCGCRVISCEALDRRGVNPATDLKLLCHYQTLLRKIQPDVVLTYTVKPDIYGGLACRRERIPYLSTVTGLGSVFEGDGIRRKMLRTLVVRMYQTALKNCRCLFFQNDTNRDTFEKLGIRAKKHRTIHGSGVNLDLFSASPLPDSGNGKSGAPVQFAFIGRVMREKGIEEYLSAAAKIKKRYPQTIFHVCGAREEEYHGRLDAAVQKGIVTCHGEILDTASFLKDIHCIVLPSFHEGMNNVLQEAAASGRCAIATDIPGCREIIEEGVTGFLVPAHDVQALTTAMERFLHLSKEERDTMGKKARKKMEREFDRKKIVEAYMEEIPG